MKPTQPQRKRFKTTQDWNNHIDPILQAGTPITGNDLFQIRKACYEEIEKLRGRPLLVYATKFIDGEGVHIVENIGTNEVRVLQVEFK